MSSLQAIVHRGHIAGNHPAFQIPMLDLWIPHSCPRHRVTWSNLPIWCLALFRSRLMTLLQEDPRHLGKIIRLPPWFGMISADKSFHKSVLSVPMCISRLMILFRMSGVVWFFFFIRLISRSIRWLSYVLKKFISRHRFNVSICFHLLAGT